MTLINGNLTTAINGKMFRDRFIWHFQTNIVTNSTNGIFSLDSINGYTPISCHITFPTISDQRHVEINYNPHNGLYYGQTTPNLSIEVWTLYVAPDF